MSGTFDFFSPAAMAALDGVRGAQNEGELMTAFRQIRLATGADQAIFASFVRGDDAAENFRFVVDGDPTWCLRFQSDASASYARDPWLLYAMQSTNPALASTIQPTSLAQREAALVAREHGVASAFIVPAPSAAGRSRAGALCLASATQAFYERAPLTPLAVYARSAAMEMNEWWVSSIRRSILERAALSGEDLALLRWEREGLKSKAIASRLNLTPAAIDSRFQRLNARLECPSRAESVKRAVELGLI